MKLTLTQVQRFTNDKEGNPLKTRDGRPYTRLLIRAKEYGDKSLSGFDGEQAKDWKEGQEVEVEVEQKGEYLNFKLPKKENPNAKQFEEVLGRLVKIELMLQQIGNAVVPKKKDDYPTPESEGLDPNNMGNFGNVPSEDEPPF